MKIQILISKSSWINNGVKKKIVSNIGVYSKKIYFLNNHIYLRKNYGLTIILSYYKLVPLKYLKRSKYNIVIHGSALPKGRGMSPISWQILNKKNIIIFSLIEAGKSFDEGRIYFQKKVNFRRSTLFSEIKNIQFNICIKLIKKFLNYYKKNKKTPKSFKQVGIPTYYKARSPIDSKLNVNKSLRSQFNLLRIVDNKKYPAFFNIFNNKYYLKIIKKQK